MGEFRSLACYLQEIFSEFKLKGQHIIHLTRTKVLVFISAGYSYQITIRLVMSALGCQSRWELHFLVCCLSGSVSLQVCVLHCGRKLSAPNKVQLIQKLILNVAVCRFTCLNMFKTQKVLITLISSLQILKHCRTQYS